MNPLRDAIYLLLIAALYLAASGTDRRPDVGLIDTNRQDVGFNPTSDVRQGREGIVTHMGPGYPASYLAIPIGPGHRVTICGPARCLSMTSTDAGPNRAMLQAGRIADVSMQTFSVLCGCSASTGVFHGSWSRVSGPVPTLPATDVAS